jgi:hypothetical protein
MPTATPRSPRLRLWFEPNTRRPARSLSAARPRSLQPVSLGVLATGGSRFRFQSLTSHHTYADTPLMPLFAIMPPQNLGVGLDGVSLELARTPSLPGLFDRHPPGLVLLAARAEAPRRTGASSRRASRLAPAGLLSAWPGEGTQRGEVLVAPRPPAPRPWPRRIGLHSAGSWPIRLPGMRAPCSARRRGALYFVCHLDCRAAALHFETSTGGAPTAGDRLADRRLLRALRWR